MSLSTADLGLHVTVASRKASCEKIIIIVMTITFFPHSGIYNAKTCNYSIHLGIHTVRANAVLTYNNQNGLFQIKIVHPLGSQLGYLQWLALILIISRGIY